MRARQHLQYEPYLGASRKQNEIHLRDIACSLFLHIIQRIEYQPSTNQADLFNNNGKEQNSSLCQPVRCPLYLLTGYRTALDSQLLIT